MFTGRLDKDKILASLLQATRTAAAVFTVLIGALLFGYFLTITQTPQKVTEFLTGLGLGRYGVLALIMLMYLVLGCLMDAMAMIILTVPIIFPVVTHLGFDPIWFGVIIVMTVELGLIHPPVGMNVFVIKSVVKDVSFATIFKGVMPFIVTDIMRLVILIAFPIIALVAALAYVAGIGYNSLDPNYRSDRDGTLVQEGSAGAQAGRRRDLPRRRHPRRHQGAAAVGRVLRRRLSGRAGLASARRAGGRRGHHGRARRASGDLLQRGLRRRHAGRLDQLSACAAR